MVCHRLGLREAFEQEIFYDIYRLASITTSYYLNRGHPSDDRWTKPVKKSDLLVEKANIEDELLQLRKQVITSTGGANRRLARKARNAATISNKAVLPTIQAQELELTRIQALITNPFEGVNIQKPGVMERFKKMLSGASSFALKTFPIVGAINRVSHGGTALHLAVEKGNLTKVKELVEFGFDVHSRDEEGCTPLILAAFQNDTVIVEYLLSEGANLHAETKGLTALHIAIRGNSMPMVEYLVSKGANLEAAGYHLLPLHVAVEDGNLPIVKYLVSHGAKINSETKEGLAPLQIAVDNNDFPMVEYLVSQEGANRKSTLQNGATPLYLGQDKSPSNQLERDFEQIILQSEGTPKEVMATFKQNITKYKQHAQYVQSLIDDAGKKELFTEDFTYFEGAQPVLLLLTGDHNINAFSQNSLVVNYINYAPSVILTSKRIDSLLGICKSLHRAAKQLPPNVKIPIVLLSAHGIHNAVKIGNKIITTLSNPKLPSDCFDPMSRDGLFILESCESGSKPFETSIAAHLSKLFNRTVLAPEEGVQRIVPEHSYMDKANPYPLHYFQHFKTPLVSAQFIAIEDYQLDEEGKDFAVKKDTKERLHFFINGQAYPQKSAKEDL